ncbi:MAG: tRNA guanosine(34) transglycosylase Tgt [Acidobacteria bacterium]|nr:MAG: tRNA guanosine(34) transglycosylase Tgt [Acidobacteriota bacterium]REK12209.1 MAG: tRNA guanosine(34) transglycosylase Tgt [Acidobacteriota bacterium]
MSGLRFSVSSTEGTARRGVLVTPHGEVQTPAFMPVGTLGAVKGLGPEALEECGAQVMLANLYHLTLRPGIERIAELGGIHAWTGWRGPILTDSGGFQVFSLGDLRQIDEQGVRFRSVHDGSRLRFTPESVVASQAFLGVDVAMVLDECPPWPIGEAEAESAQQRTHRWAVRSLEERSRHDDWPGALFAIVQGSFYPELRARAASELAALPFDGFAIGGVSVGEEKSLGRAVVSQIAPGLPADRPRYLMGVGTPADIAFAVRHGVDLFDCVLPSRNARHGTLFTSGGTLRIKNARFATDPRPVDPECSCVCCRRVSRAFLHHLFRSGEITAKVLATAHNVRFFLDFVGQLREALASGCLAATVDDWIALYDDESPTSSSSESC